MEIVCQNCQSKFKVADEKLPSGSTASLKCPKCKTRMTITIPKVVSEARGGDFDDCFGFDESDGDSETYDAKDKPFDFIEEEGKTALVCESDPAVRKKIKPVLDILEFHVTEAKNSRDALKKMRYHTYDLIVVNEYFDTKDPDANGVLIYLERQPMLVRRNIFVALISSRYRTMDHMTAFQKSVNMIVNLSNMDDFDKILQRGLADYGIFYRVFKESLEQ